MQHEMKRKKQALSKEEICTILREATYGVLALSNNGEPYAIPLNFVYSPTEDAAAHGAFYFHCAKHGHKLELMQNNPQASFCVVEKHDVIPDLFSTAYRSVIAFGTIEILDGKAAHHELYTLADKFNPGAHDAIEQEIASDGKNCYVVKLKVDHMTGKQARSLVS